MAYWFKPKRYGFGAFPVTWQGWALTGAYIAAIMALSAWFAVDAEAGEPRTLPFAAVTGALTLIFVVICWRTTEGGWRWRWGRKD